MVLRAKTKELLCTKELTDLQKINSKLNLLESSMGEVNLTSFPRRVVLELTNNCNFKCQMCVDRSKFNVINLEFAKVYGRISNILNYSEECCLFGFGEPSLHPDFTEILKLLNEVHPNIRKYFVTNGSNLDKIKDSIFESRVDIMAISLDGACAETNNRIRIGSDFNKIVLNLKEIVKFKNENNLSYPYMNFVFCAMDSNLNELPQMVELTKEIDLDELKVVFLTVFDKELLHESLYNQQDRVRHIFEEAEKRAKELNIKLKLPFIQGLDYSMNNYHKPCYLGYRDLFVSCNSHIRPCMSNSLDFGNVEDYESFNDLWNSDNFKKFRVNVNNKDSKFVKSRMPDDCKKCFQSSHSNTNREEAFIQVNENYLFDWSNK